MCPYRFYLLLNGIVKLVSLLNPRLLQKNCFPHLANYFYNELRWAVAYFMKIFLFIGREYTLKISGLQVEFSMLQLEFYVQNLDMNFQKQF